MPDTSPFATPLGRRIAFTLTYLFTLFDAAVLVVAVVSGQWGLAAYFVFLLAVMAAAIRSMKASYATLDALR